MKLSYRSTLLASFTGYVVQAITINFAPLLYLTFQTNYALTIPQISSLIAVCFAIQMITDALAVKFADKMHPRASVIAAHVLAAVGIGGLGFLPEILPPYLGLLLAVLLSGMGSGLVEVMVSPIVEACPTKHKSAAMSLLHSFYCWGQASVALFSTLFFATAGIENWRYLALIWALIPAWNAVLFAFVPIALPPGGKDGAGRTFLKNKMFWLLIAVMLCAGAAEMAMGQWASSFAESALGVSKTVGDLLGPCMFAILMGSARVFYAKFSTKISLRKFMIFSGALCIVSYLVAALAPHPMVALVGCAMCGLAVGIMWPGGLSMAAGRLSTGGVSMFAFLALAGDLGCLSGPTVVGNLAAIFDGGIRASFLAAILFPLLLIASLLALPKNTAKKPSEKHE